MMRLQIHSDLHLEFRNYNYSITPKADRLILAGDIGNPLNKKYFTFLEDCSNKFKKVFLVPGNHEYYGNNMRQVKITLEDYSSKLGNIVLLDNNVHKEEGFTFIGSTLWSKITKEAFKSMADSVEIRKGSTILTLDDYNSLHEDCVNFLDKELEKNENCIVITHHLPTTKYKHPKYADSYLNPGFMSDTGLIEKHSPLLWVFGHTHYPFDDITSRTRIICNPLGYPREDSKHDPEKVVEVRERCLEDL